MFQDDKKDRRTASMLDLKTNRSRRIKLDQRVRRSRSTELRHELLEPANEAALRSIVENIIAGAIGPDALVPPTPHASTFRSLGRVTEPYCDLCQQWTESYSMLMNPIMCKKEGLRHISITPTQQTQEMANTYAEKIIARFHAEKSGSKGRYWPMWLSNFCDLTAVFESVRIERTGDEKADKERLCQELNEAIEEQIHKSALQWALSKEGGTPVIQFSKGTSKKKRTSKNRKSLPNEGQEDEKSSESLTDGLTTPSPSFCNNHNPSRSNGSQKLYDKDRALQTEFENEIFRLNSECLRPGSEFFLRFRPWSPSDHGEIRKIAYENIHHKRNPPKTIDSIRELQASGIYSVKIIAEKLNMTRQAVYKALAKAEGRYPRSNKPPIDDN